MIWTRGEIIPDEALRISVLDRTFEHGLGLFETFRTWNGHPTLLDRHLRADAAARPRSSACRSSPATCRTTAAVRRLAARRSGRLPARATSGSGSPSPAGPSADRPDSAATALDDRGAAAAADADAGARIDRSILADPDDPLARHKTLNYWRRRIAQERAAAEGADEVLCVTPDGLICEGTRSNLFLVRGRSPDHARAPTARCSPGIMRRVVLEQARNGRDRGRRRSGAARGHRRRRRGIPDQLRPRYATGRPAPRIADLPAPGPVTRRLWDEILPWLESGGTTP